MNDGPPTIRPLNRSANPRAAVALTLGMWLAGCHPASAPPAPPPQGKAAPAEPMKESAVILTPEQIQKMGLRTSPAIALNYSAEVEGYGTVASHEAVAAAVAELLSAQATSRQSEAALARTQRLAGTAGALSAEAAESNERQAAVDLAALTLSKQRLSSTLGQNPPWKNGDRTLKALSDGALKLVRVTFPLGALSGQPHQLRAAPIGGGASRPWTLESVWPAPGDAAVPGHSYFALLPAADIGEGERLVVWAPSGVSIAGALVPSAAAVISGGRYWCYVEKAPGRFVRLTLEADKPVDAGYVVTANVAVGDRLVVSGAGLLLAQESNSGADSDPP